MTEDSLDTSPFENDERRIRTTRLVMRKVIAADAAEIARQAGDKQIAMMTARIPHPYSLADAKAFIAKPGDEFVRAVTLVSNGCLVGVAGLKPHRDGRAVELGYWFGADHWGRGYGTEAAQAFVDFAFVSSDIECVWARCRVINAASRRVLEKCGFQMRRMGILDSVCAGRVSTEDYHLDRGAWTALKAWGGK
ncbi:GNAT family N-acetyltransferase [Aurantimonas marina]|uniref:GNAT family N-acetyltransferase n=1 Tax=Aurantimonas marina TaxID=2780508 RepID=UPI001E3D071D|nr:GNAT family N-acetyltransferase [Aurantimonas marina]